MKSIKKSSIVGCLIGIIVLLGGCARSDKTELALSSSAPGLPSEVQKLHYWDAGQQFDPTLPENRERLWEWRHTEYKAFGRFSDFGTHNAVISDIENGTSQKITLRLPLQYSVDESGSIRFDGQFENGTIQAGYLHGYHKLQSEETVFENMLRHTLFTDALQPANERESDEVVIGAYTDIGKSIRYVMGAPSQNLSIVYMVPLRNGYVTMLAFYIDEDITPQHDMTIYDEIARSIIEAEE